MKIRETEIEETFAEAFSMRYTRLAITAVDRYWVDTAVREFCGYGTSVIGCDAECGLERYLEPEETEDGRPGAMVMAFAFNEESLGKAIANRCGQCLMTCPTTAAYNGLESDTMLPLGKGLRFFGDGFQKSKMIGDRRYWRIPVMDGEFMVEETFGVAKGIAGGNILIQSTNQTTGLAAARKSVEAIAKVSGVITPFPGGVVRSGSKVGSRYDGLVASTSHTFCPTLKGRITDSNIHDLANCVYEIVIDGEDKDAIELAMIASIDAAATEGVVAISAGNYGGKLGKHHFQLHELAARLNDGETTAESA